jgi:hypothetical protein
MRCEAILALLTVVLMSGACGILPSHPSWNHLDEPGSNQAQKLQAAIIAL